MTASGGSRASATFEQGHRASGVFLHLAPTPDGGNNSIRIILPHRGPGFLVVLLDEAIDGGPEVNDGVEDAVFQSPAGQLGEKALDGIELRTRCRHEMEGPARVPGQPGADLRLFIGSIIVEDDMASLVGGQFGFDRIEEPDKLLMPVALHVATDHRPIEDFERSK